MFLYYYNPRPSIASFLRLTTWLSNLPEADKCKLMHAFHTTLVNLRVADSLSLDITSYDFGYGETKMPEDIGGVLQSCSSDEDFPNFWSSCSGRFIRLLEIASIVSSSNVEASIAFLGIRGIPVQSCPGCMYSLIARVDQTRGR